MKDWYGRGDYPLHVTSATAVWYKTGTAVPIRWVLIKDPKGKFEPKRSMHGLDGHASSNLAMVSLSLAGRSHFEEARAHLGLNLNVNGHHGRLPALPCATCPVLNRDPRGSSATSSASV